MQNHYDDLPHEVQEIVANAGITLQDKFSACCSFRFADVCGTKEQIIRGINAILDSPCSSNPEMTTRVQFAAFIHNIDVHDLASLNLTIDEKAAAFEYTREYTHNGNMTINDLLILSNHDLTGCGFILKTAKIAREPKADETNPPKRYYAGIFDGMTVEHLNMVRFKKNRDRSSYFKYLDGTQRTFANLMRLQVEENRSGFGRCTRVFGFKYIPDHERTFENFLSLKVAFFDVILLGLGFTYIISRERSLKNFIRAGIPFWVFNKKRKTYVTPSPALSVISHGDFYDDVIWATRREARRIVIKIALALFSAVSLFFIASAKYNFNNLIMHHIQHAILHIPFFARIISITLFSVASLILLRLITKSVTMLHCINALNKFKKDHFDTLEHTDQLQDTQHTDQLQEIEEQLRKELGEPICGLHQPVEEFGASYPTWY